VVGRRQVLVERNCVAIAATPALWLEARIVFPFSPALRTRAAGITQRNTNANGNLMSDTETSAMRLVEGGELHLQRSPGASWEVNFYDATMSAVNAVGQSGRRSEGISKLFAGETFSTPDDAAAACRRLVVL
jgi:hypothetical protein